MHILLTGTESCGIDAVERSLRAAGHKTFSCTEDATLGCHAITDPARCPVNAGIDVIVAVRQHPLPHLTAREQLTECARLAAVPLVVAGSTVLNPFGARSASCVEGFDEIIGAVSALRAGGSDAAAEAGVPVGAMGAPSPR